MQRLTIVGSQNSIDEGAPSNGQNSTAILRLQSSSNGYGEVLDLGMNIKSYGWIQPQDFNVSNVFYNLILNGKGGNVGIGTTAPTAKLHVNNGDNSYGTILANASESAFSLYAKSLNTQVLAESFRLGLKHDNNEDNGFISFYRGGSVNGGFLGFSTNGTERVRINSTGNVGIGTISPNSKFEVYNTAQAGHLLLSANDNPNADNTRIDIDFSVANQGHTVGRVASFYDDSTNGGSGGLKFYTRNRGSLIENVRINHDGTVGIGTKLTGSHKLAVEGSIGAREVKVYTTAWSDFVFKKEYALPTLEEVEQHIKKKGHLENIPSEEEVLKDGINLGEMNAKLLQKIEELTLYMIEQNKRLSKMEAENTILKNRLNNIETN